MNEKIRKHLTDYAVKNNLETDDETLIEILTETDSIWESERDSHRWWDAFTKVVNINGMIIGFRYASTTGDASIFDVGWKFDPSSVEEYVPKIIQATIYEPIN